MTESVVVGCYLICSIAIALFIVILVDRVQDIAGMRKCRSIDKRGHSCRLKRGHIGDCRFELQCVGVDKRGKSCTLDFLHDGECRSK